MSEFSNKETEPNVTAASNSELREFYGTYENCIASSGAKRKLAKVLAKRRCLKIFGLNKT